MKKKSQITLSPTVNYVEKLTITDDDSMTAAVVVLSKLNKELDKLTTDKEKLTKPMNEALKEIRSRYKPFESQLEAAIKHVRTMMTEYQTEMTRLVNEEQRKLAGRVGNGLTIEKALQKMGDLVSPEEKITTTSGSVSFRATRKWRLVDIDKVPRNYLIPNDTEITTAMKANRPIEGIEYYTEQQPINRR